MVPVQWPIDIQGHGGTTFPAVKKSPDFKSTSIWIVFNTIPYPCPPVAGLQDGATVLIIVLAVGIEPGIVSMWSCDTTHVNLPTYEYHPEIENTCKHILEND